jgi:tripartite ATP-independent transporter DctP family solute receptor
MMLKMSRKLLLGILMISVLLQASLIMAANPTAQNPLICKIGYTDPPTQKIGDEEINNVGWTQMLAFQSAVEKYSQGRAKVELYANGRLGDNSSMLEQILNENIFGICTGEKPFSSFYKVLQVTSIPYVFKDDVMQHKILDGSFGRKLFNDMAAKSGFRVLSWGNGGGFVCFSNRKKKLRVPADMKNLKMRCADVPLDMAVAKASGAIPCPVAWLEVYSALQTGVVDGMFHLPTVLLGMSFQEVQKYLTLSRHSVTTSMIVTNEKFLKSLPADLQKVFVKAGQEASIAERRAAADMDAYALKVLEQKGMQIYKPTLAEMKIWEKTLKAPGVAWFKKNVDPKWVDELLKAADKASKGK